MSWRRTGAADGVVGLARAWAYHARRSIGSAAARVRPWCLPAPRSPWAFSDTERDHLRGAASRRTMSTRAHDGLSRLSTPAAIWLPSRRSTACCAPMARPTAAQSTRSILLTPSRNWASGPRELWSWDITKLKGPAKWAYFHLYVILDVFSRYVVGWMLAPRESAALAKELMRRPATTKRSSQINSLCTPIAAPRCAQAGRPAVSDLVSPRAMAAPMSATIIRSRSRSSRP